MSNDYRSRQERRQKQKANAKTKKDRASLVKKILLGLLLFIGAGLVAGTIAVFAIIQDAPTLKPAMLDTPFTTTFYDRNNDPIPTEFSETIERDKVDIKNVPEMMKQAVISIEDRRFYDHFGIDVRRIIGAAIDDIRKGRLAEGGSTITQQVVKRSILSPKKTFVRKIQEAWLAIQLEQHYTKDEILEMYLNKIYYGNGAYGLKTAAEVYFDTKDLSKLNLSQMALLAGLPNAPSAYDPYEHPKKAAERRNQVLEAMVETGAISEKQAQEAKAKPVTKLLAKKDEDSTPPYYGAFLEEVFKELKEQKIVTDLTQFKQGGLKIYTTVDPESQKKVYKLQHSDEIPYPDKNFDIGAALLDTKTGAIRAIGGGRDYTSFQSGTNRALDTSNIPGSNIKPILDYGPAIEFLKWPTVHPIVDEKYKYPGSDTVVGEWDGEYWGKMTIERALAWSRNVPAVKALVATTEEVGKDKVSGFVQGLGIPLKDSYYYSAALGTMNVSPLQMAGAYSAFGNKGVYHEPYAVRKVVFPNGKTVELHHEPEVAMHDYTAYMITDMLKAVVNKGTGQMADISGLPVAGKTGSTQIPDKTQEKYDISEDGYLDEWFTGYTPEFTLSVWTGYPSITDEDGNVQFIRFGEGIDATDLAKLYFKKLISDISSKDVEDWEMPDSVVKVAIEKDTRKLPSENTPEKDIITGLFVKGTQPTEVSDKYKKLESPQNLQAVYDEKHDEITVTWEYPKEAKDIAFELAYAADGGEMQKLGTTDKTMFKLKNPKPGSTYNIQVTAVSKDGNRSSDPAATTIEIESAVPLHAPTDLQAHYDETNDLISISWAYEEDPNVAFQVGYSVDGGPMQLLGTTTQHQAVINQPKHGSTYEIVVMTQNKETGEQSEPAATSVEVPADSPTDALPGTEKKKKTESSETSTTQ